MTLRSTSIPITSIAHSAVTGVTAAQHHTKYLDAEAIAAIEAEASVVLAGTLAVATGAPVTADGMQFPAVQVPVADANALDDYEEQTFTPSIEFGGAAVGATYSVQVGTYTKVGREVHFHISLTLTSNGTSVGQANIVGLPFTIAATSHGGVNIGRAGNVSFANQLVIRLDESSDSLGLREHTEAGVDSALTEANVADNAFFELSGSYFV